MAAEAGTEEEGRAGERIVAASRRPDGSMRKPIRIRAGYTPQDEVAIYHPKALLLRQRGQPEVPPGYDPSEDLPQRPKTKAAKKNQKRKEKKHQGFSKSGEVEAALSVTNGRTTESLRSKELNDLSPREDTSTVTRQISTNPMEDKVDSVTQQISAMSVKAEKTIDKTNGDMHDADTEKRIRALRKKIRETEALKASLESKGVLANAEQAVKLSKLDIWQKELNEMEKQ